MNRKLLAILLLTLLSAPLTAQQAGCVTDIRGNQICGTRAGQCLLDRYGAAWCAPDNGTAMKDRYDEVVCGAGVCVKDGRSGEIACSPRSSGTTVTDVGGNLVCEGGCVPASKSACRRATPN
jgi:hypothetical protein